MTEKKAKSKKTKKIISEELFSTELLKLIAIWSLIPSYGIAGGAIGYGIDRGFNTFPYFTGAGILIAFGLAVRDMLRLRNEVFK